MYFGARRTSFAVPATSGQYAPEILYLRAENDRGGFDSFSHLTLLVESLTATAVAEIDLLRVGGDEDTAADWRMVDSTNAAGLKQLAEVARWWGARVRVKSGGTAGTTLVSANWALRS